MSVTPWATDVYLDTKLACTDTATGFGFFEFWCPAHENRLFGTEMCWALQVAVGARAPVVLEVLAWVYRVLQESSSVKGGKYVMQLYGILKTWPHSSIYSLFSEIGYIGCLLIICYMVADFFFAACTLNNAWLMVFCTWKPISSGIFGTSFLHTKPNDI